MRRLFREQHDRRWFLRRGHEICETEAQPPRTMDNLKILKSTEHCALGKGTSYYSIYHCHSRIKHMSHLESTKLETLDLPCAEWRPKSRRLGDGRWQMVEGNWEGKMGKGDCDFFVFDDVKYTDE